jgi:hypothetical protein
MKKKEKEWKRKNEYLKQETNSSKPQIRNKNRNERKHHSSRSGSHGIKTQMLSQKLKSSKKESHEDIGASGRDFFTHMGVVKVLVVARGKQCSCEEEEEEGQRQTDRGRARETGIGRVASRHTTTRRRQEGSTASCSNKARERKREQSDGLWALRSWVSGQTAEQRTREAGYIPGARRASCVRLNG